MDCNCIYCRNGFSQEVQSLAESNSLEKIAEKYRQSHNIGNAYVLRKHFEALGISYQSDKPPPTMRMSGDVLHPVVVQGHNPIDLSSELSLSRWGLNDGDPQSIIAFLQEKLLALGIQQIEVVASQQRDYLNGSREDEPSKESINNLVRLMGLADKFTSISLIANQQQAIRVVQSLGLTGEQLNEVNAAKEEQ